MDRELIEKKIKEVARDGYLPCADGLRLANELECAPATIGKICDELNIKITECSLGCF